MTASTPLTPTAYVVLGLLAERGPSTSYDLEQAVAVSIGHFWSFPRSQLYSEPARLVQAGLVSEQQESTGRRRRRLTVTEDGLRALQDWLAHPVGTGTEIRDLGLLKLFFGSRARDPEDVRASAAAQAETHRAQAAVYEQIAALDGLDPHVQATVTLGLAYERAAVEMWEQVADR